MKNLFLVFLMVVVAGVSYQVGRISGASKAAVAPALVVSAETKTAGPAAPIHLQAETPAIPFVQRATHAQRGYEAAQVDIEAALKMAETLPGLERAAFVTGIFSFVAKNFSPAEGLKIYARAPDSLKAPALKALAAEWINSRSPLDEEAKQLKRESALATSGGKMGLEVELSHLLASAKPDAGLTGAWLEAFSKHSGRSEILSIMSGAAPAGEIDSVLSKTDGWTDWEKERVTRNLLGRWAAEKPQEAWGWYQQQKGRFGQDYSWNIFEPWTRSDLDGVKNLLTTVQDPDQRQALIRAVGIAATRKNTEAAVAWADSLPNAEERAAAHRIIYDETPRGVGAVLRAENGFPTLSAILPGSPLDGSGVKPGDQLLEVRTPDGSRRTLYGTDLSVAVNLIHGEPGTEVTLRLLRQNASSGGFEEHLIAVKRGQLMLNEKFLPKPEPERIAQ
jgi:hypothetical protein